MVGSREVESVGIGALAICDRVLLSGCESCGRFARIKSLSGWMGRNPYEIGLSYLLECCLAGSR